MCTYFQDTVCAPLNLVNGSVTYSRPPGCHDKRTTASFSCDDGFSLSKSLSSTCEASSGIWTGSNPTCDPGKEMNKLFVVDCFPIYFVSKYCRVKN